MITGAAGFSPLGASWPEVRQALLAEKNGTVRMHEWDEYQRLNSKLAAPAKGFSIPSHYTRKQLRTMGPVARMAVRASELALADAGLTDADVITNGDTGVAYGSSAGSSETMTEFSELLVDKRLDGLNATSYLRMMSHTAAVNISIHFGIKGRIIPTSSACTAGSQGIGYAYEAIKFGRQKLMVAGGAEELCVSHTGVFDVLFATSTCNDSPSTSPRPYDAERDGLVIGEGACTLILESLDHALARGARIKAELVGYGTNADGMHATRPSVDTMAAAMRLALDDAGTPASEIGYVNGHGTATEHGDIAETIATADVFGAAMPISSLKSYIGHTLGASGALEAWYSLEMMNDEWFSPTINLDNVDERCAELDYIRTGGRQLSAEYVMTNNFAFGGINTSLVIKRWPD